jgi:hypothetical protein
MLSTTIEYLAGETGLRRIVFCLYGEESFSAFVDELRKQTEE